MEKPKVLFLCNKSPWPPKEGGSMAMNQLIEGLTEAGHKVKVLAVSSSKYPATRMDIPPGYLEKTDIEFVDINLSVKPLPAFLNLFSKESYHVRRFISKDFEKKLTGVLQKEKFDIVQMETLFMAPYLSIIRKYSKAKVLLRAHNIEHLIWKRLALASRNPVKKQYLRHLYTTLENFEKTVLDRFDGILPITEKDALFFKKQSHRPVKTIPFGINTENYPLWQNNVPEHALFHIGAMNWMPNQEGITWFLNEVWPGLIRKHPEIKLYLAGRAMPGWLRNLKEKNIIIAGEVPDARAFIASKNISIAPLFSGSGVRVKIIESMAMGKAVVATTTGAEGIEYTPGKEIMIADTPGDFLNAVSDLYLHPSRAEEMGKNARKLMEEKHNNRKIIQRLVQFYHEIL